MRTCLCALLVLVATSAAFAQGTPPRPAPTPGADMRPIPELLAEAQTLYDAFKETRNPDTFKEVLALLGTALKREPLNTDANLMSGEIGLESNDFDTAREHFRNVLGVEPNNYRANLGMGKIWLATRSFRQAAVFLQTAERVAPDNDKSSTVKQLLASTYVASGDVPRAIETAEEAARMAPDSIDALATLATIRVELAKRDPAIVTAAVKDAETFVSRCREDARQDQSNVEKLRRLDAAHGMLVDALKLLYSSYYERDIRGQATTRLLRGKEADAAAALNRTAEVMLDKATVSLTLMQHDIIKIAAQPAAELDPKSVKYLETLAGLFEKTGNRTKAIETAQKILELDPAHSGAREFLTSVGAPSAAAPSSTPPATTQPAGGK